MRSVNVQVFGKVQGVSYRYSTMLKAKSLDLTGWVQNEVDGSVMIYARGIDDAVDSFIQWCHIGPSAADVKNVIVEDTRHLSSQPRQSFEIRR